MVGNTDENLLTMLSIGTTQPMTQLHSLCTNRKLWKDTLYLFFMRTKFYLQVKDRHKMAIEQLTELRRHFPTSDKLLTVELNTDFLSFYPHL